jgi:hypothetical protein
MSHEDAEMNKPEMNEIEAALAAWTPRAPQIDRDRLMFAAGRASVDSPVIMSGRRVTRYLWPFATTLSTAAALVMAFLLAQNERAASSPTAAHTQVAAPTPRSITEIAIAGIPPRRGGMVLPGVADGTYLALRNRMLTTPSDQWPITRSLNTETRSNAAAVRPLESGARDAARPAATSRNLLQEFLPRENEPEGTDAVDTPAAFGAEHNEVIS